MSPKSSIARSSEAAGVWFLDSGIQEPNGGVARYYRGDLCRNERVSNEITGYAISAYCWLYQRSAEERYLSAAKRAATLLVDRAWQPEPGIWPFEYPADTPETALAYFFDTGIIVRGLLALWRNTRNQKWLDAAVAGCDSLNIFRTAGDGEVFHPILQLPSLEPLPYTPQWSRGPGCYQLKSAMAWHDVAAVTGNASFSAAFARAMGSAMATAPTFLPADTPSRTMDRLHAYCYYLEALLTNVGKPGVDGALADGIRNVAAWLRQIRPTFERSDVNAQLLRVRLLAAQAGAVPLNHAEAAEEAARVRAFQSTSADRHLAGGFAFGQRDGQLIPHSNPVSTSFCMQALDLWADYQSGIPLELASLI